MDNEATIKKYEDILRKYNILNLISQTVASTLDLNKLLNIILTGVTFGNGFGFNRAFLFLLDREEKNLVGRMAIGPSTEDEAWHVWESIQEKDYSLEEFFNSENYSQSHLHETINEQFKRKTIPLKNQKALFLCLDDGRPRRVDLTADSPLATG